MKVRSIRNMHGFLKWEGHGDAWCVLASSLLGLRVPFAVITVILVGGRWEAGWATWASVPVVKGLLQMVPRGISVKFCLLSD